MLCFNLTGETQIYILFHNKDYEQSVSQKLILIWILQPNLSAFMSNTSVYLVLNPYINHGKQNHYFFPNLKHLLCFSSVILGVEVSCFVAVCLAESFSIALMNLRKCLMYSGYVSRLQCPPPFTHNGSYFSFASSHSRFPWDQSTISSFVPCTFIKLAGLHHPTT